MSHVEQHEADIVSAKLTSAGLHHKLRGLDPFDLVGGRVVHTQGFVTFYKEGCFMLYSEPEGTGFKAVTRETTGTPVEKCFDDVTTACAWIIQQLPC